MKKEQFTSPDKRYKIFPIIHSPYVGMSEQLKKFGSGGAVTNVPWSNGFTSNPANINLFDNSIKELEENGYGHWIYDEVGYPSGYGGELVLKDHPEFAAKGFYMVKRMSFGHMQATFHLDEVSEKIVWAAKYPIYAPYRGDFFTDYDNMKTVPFTKDTVEYTLDNELIFIFCVKDTFEGAHSTHNNFKVSKDLNIMDPRAVRHFIDCCYEPIVRDVPDAYSRAVGIFTDEPSLQTSYARPYSRGNWALAPWVDGLFEEYEKMYGESLLPSLPLIFEGTTDRYPPVRVKFYNLVGELIARAFSEQLSDWCKAHGGIFSGHYLLEEEICHHVMQYGNYLRVLMGASYPGIDALYGHPEVFDYNAMKFAQMAVRKKHTEGMMLEFCPIIGQADFQKNYPDNMRFALSAFYMGGVRHTHTYFQPTDPEE